jgi:hypothetical protein
MEVKGTSVRSVIEFIDKFYADRKQEWINALPEESRKIMTGYLFTNNWYPIKESLIVPMKVISKLFFNGDDVKTARTMGRYSADVALGGVYRFFIQFGSPRYIIERGSRVFATYFQPSSLEVLNENKNGITVQTSIFPESDTIVEENIAGWMERALEKSGCKNVKVIITQSLAKKDPVTEYSIQWSESE